MPTAMPRDSVQRPHPRWRWRVLAGLLALCYAILIASGLISSRADWVWYSSLVQPGFLLPASLFLAIEFVIHTLIAIAAWRVWRAAGNFAEARTALIPFFVQLALNLAWPFLFFDAQRMGLALIDLGALTCLILLTTVRFWQIERIASLLMLPYFAWVVYMTAWNAALWQLN